MRTNIEIDDALLAKVMEVTNQKTKKATIEEALRRAVENDERRKALQRLAGMGWEGDLDQMRDDWSPEKDWGLHEK